MSADTQAFFALNRKATEEFLAIVIIDMDQLTLKNAVHTLISSYRSYLLKGLSNDVVPSNAFKLQTKKPSYVAPPRVRDAEENWPFMRCKNVARALRDWSESAPIPRSHHALLEYLAKKANTSVETLKKTSPRDLFKNNYHQVLVGTWR
jgi:hypothetical protein